MDVSIIAWLAVLGVVLVMLVVDLFMHRDAHEISVREAGIWTGIWIALGLAVGGVIWWYYGGEFGMQYLTAYVVEKSLAIDNVFVWAVIFTYFAIPARYQHRILFYGVLGALIMRAIFIALGSVLVSNFSWVLYLFGAFLVFTGFKMLQTRNDNSHGNPENSRLLRLFKRLVPSTEERQGDKFFIRVDGKRLATPLLAALVVVEVTDLIFAVDSIPAVFAVTQEPFLVFASNALAILGLRSMYFLLADLIHRFIYLKLGLSLVLIWVGVKMLVGHSLVSIPTVLSLGIVISILGISIAASIIRTRVKAEG